LGTNRLDVSAERVAGRLEGATVWVEVPLRRGDRPVPGDLLEDVDRHAGIGHPGQAGVAQVVTAVGRQQAGRGR
jgi:hypothetical protein